MEQEVRRIGAQMEQLHQRMEGSEAHLSATIEKQFRDWADRVGSE